MSNIDLVSLVFTVVMFVESLHLIQRGWFYYSSVGVFNQNAHEHIFLKKRLSIFNFVTEKKWQKILYIINSVIILSLIFKPQNYFAWFFVIVMLASRIGRNPWVISDGDRLTLLICILFIFRSIGLEDAWIEFGLRLLCTIVYCYTAINKFQNKAWRSGIAVYQVFYHAHPRRKNIASPQVLDYFFVSFFASWFVMLSQFFIGVGIWFENLRGPCILLALVTHIGLEIFFNTKAFQFIIMSLMMINFKFSWLNIILK